MELLKEQILQAVARGWCAEGNTHKVMDPDLATAIADEVYKAVGDVSVALFEVVDAVASVDKPWDLQGYGIEPKRAEQICELAVLGRF
jgi:hypothetical protein